MKRATDKSCHRVDICNDSLYQQEKEKDKPVMRLNPLITMQQCLLLTGFPQSHDPLVKNRCYKELFLLILMSCYEFFILNPVTVAIATQTLITGISFQGELYTGCIGLES